MVTRILGAEGKLVKHFGQKQIWIWQAKQVGEGKKKFEMQTLKKHVKFGD